jgi:eukaryotic-like serine/threonine-protein kinase
MTPERWIRVKEVFAAALEQEAAHRASYVEQACSGDDELRTEVISLLEAHDTAGAFIEEEAAQRIGLASAVPRKEWIGQRLGPYRIVDEAGRGGMSQVFKAVRDDEQYEKQVAIKLLKPGLDTESLLRRFKAERQILAQLSHPHIAHLLDGGATEDGAPYLVMEYIEGNPIDVYCDVKQLGVNERLDLFRDLCSAVHYVHQHLMVHGDIKGGNVFVTEQGIVKLLDFGIAKLLGPTPSAVREATGFMALTPEYASPEQVRGEPITTASDIYSLGVLLYRLLSGALPYEATGSTTWALAKQICEHDPRPPSVTAEEATTGYGRFAKTLRGDLDNIVLKALKKAPEERYPSAEQFAEDLRRYLRGFPVTARADTTGYRIRKFAQRHRSAAVAGALFVVALIAGIVTTSWQAHRAEVQRLRAERHLNEVRELTSIYLAEVYDAVAFLPGGTKARKLLVENSVKYLAGLEREAQDSPQLQRDLAVAYDRLADVQGDYIGANIGDTEGALESHRRALRLRRALAQSEPSQDARRELLRSCVKLSELLMGQSTVPEALSLGREGAQVADSLLQDKSASSRDRRYAAAAYMNYGWAQGLAGDVESGMQWLEKARTLHEQLARRKSGGQRRATQRRDRERTHGRRVQRRCRRAGESAALLRACVAAGRTDRRGKQRRCRVATHEGVHAVIDRGFAEQSAATVRGPCELSACTRHHRAVARRRSRRPVWAAGGGFHAERPRRQSPPARRPLGSAARFQRSGEDPAQRPAAAADRHGRDPHAAGRHVCEPRARHGRHRATECDAEKPASQLRARSRRMVTARARNPRAAHQGRARRPAHARGHRRDERSHCCASSRLPKIRICTRGLSLSIWNIRAKPN